MYGLKKYVPGVGKEFKVLFDEINFTTVSGSGTTGSVSNAASTTVTITHATPFNLNTVPTVTTSTASCTVTVANIKLGSFDIVATNNSGSSTTIAYAWTRTGL